MVYVHTNEGKLNPISKKGVFTGYPEGVKGFRVWLTEEERCVISRNVIFREELMYKDINKTDSGNSIPVPYDLTNKNSSLDLAGNQEEQVTAQGGVSCPSGDGETSAQSETTDTSVEAVRQQDLKDYQLVRDRGRRQIRQPSKFSDYQVYEGDEVIAGFAYLVMEDDGRPESSNHQEAWEDPDSELWTGAEREEMASLVKNGTWVLVDRVKDEKPIGCKWVYKRKAGIERVEDPRFKTRLVAKGYA